MAGRHAPAVPMEIQIQRCKFVERVFGQVLFRHQMLQDGREENMDRQFKPHVTYAGASNVFSDRMPYSRPKDDDDIMMG